MNALLLLMFSYCYMFVFYCNAGRNDIDPQNISKMYITPVLRFLLS